MSFLRLWLPALALSLAVGATVLAQSLADVARAEADRRKTVQASSRKYTNADLRGARGGLAAPREPEEASPREVDDEAVEVDDEAAETDDVDGGAAQGEVHDEDYWRTRIRDAEEQVERTRVLLDAMQSRINALTTDFVNVDDPGQRSLVEQNRNRALAELDRLQQDLDTQIQRVDDIRDEARQARVPSGWLR